MSVSFWINSIEFQDQQKIQLKKDSIVVFVGPNNGGKSTALREIIRHGNGLNGQNHLIKSISISLEGSSLDLEERLKNRLFQNTYMYYDSSHNSGTDKNNLLRNWNEAVAKGDHKGFGISNFFIKELKTSSRLELVNPAVNIDVHSEVYSHPIHIIKAERDKEQLFSDYFKSAFGEEIIVNHSAGSKIPLHVGERPTATSEHDRVSNEYQQALRKLPYLHEQGDGMKSFAGVFLSLFAEKFTINLIDEPEAFLHPPQATLLGRMMGQKLDEDKQLFIATHSEHLLKGLLDSASQRLVVVRISRNGSFNKINILDNTELKNIWNDSILRHSNILDGLFHKKVVLVESDSDCRFYNTLLMEIVQNNKIVSPDILFIQSGGKHRFPTVIKALKKLEVPLTVIGDFDLYHEENPAKQIYEELGGNWKEISADFFNVKKSIDQKKPELETDELKEAIEKIFSSITETVMPDKKIEEIKDALKKASPWKQAKQSGKAYLPAGDTSISFNRVQEAFKTKGFYILEIGEIEAFDKSVGGHGPKWVNLVLEKDVINTKELEEARKFINECLLK